MVRTTAILVSALALAACSPAQIYQYRVAQVVQQSREPPSDLPLAQACDVGGYGIQWHDSAACQGFRDRQHAVSPELAAYAKAQFGTPLNTREQYIVDHLPELEFQSCMIQLRSPYNPMASSSCGSGHLYR